jgi:hypothetical protein
MIQRHARSFVKQAVLLLTLCAALVMTAGCRHNPVVALSDDNKVLQPPKDAVLVANPRSPLPDVPAPVGFDLIPARSTGRINPGGTREVRHVYQGLADFAATVDFYRRNAAQHGWQSVHQEAGSQDTIMTFRSQRETLEIRLTRPSRILTVTVIIRSREYSVLP